MDEYFDILACLAIDAVHGDPCDFDRIPLAIKKRYMDLGVLVLKPTKYDPNTDAVHLAHWQFTMDGVDFLLNLNSGEYYV